MVEKRGDAASKTAEAAGDGTAEKTESRLAVDKSRPKDEAEARAEREAQIADMEAMLQGYRRRQRQEKLRTVIAAVCLLLTAALLLDDVLFDAKSFSDSKTYTARGVSASFDENLPLPTGEININTADAQALTALPGIGAVLAENIVEERETNGAFEIPEDLLNVSGIGLKTLEAIRPYIRLKEP